MIDSHEKPTLVSKISKSVKQDLAHIVSKQTTCFGYLENSKADDKFT